MNEATKAWEMLMTGLRAVDNVIVKGHHISDEDEAYLIKLREQYLEQLNFIMRKYEVMG